jgi:hypothetical protein
VFSHDSVQQLGWNQFTGSNVGLDLFAKLAPGCDLLSQDRAGVDVIEAIARR